MKQKTEQGHLTARYRLFTFFVLVLLAMIAVAGLWGSQRILLKNAARMGQNLAQSYASDEQHHIEIYQNVIRMGMTYLEDYTAAGASYEKIESWMIDFFQKAADATGEGNITFYAIVDEKIIASQPFEGIEQYDFRQATWYQQAIDARGQVIFTDAYKSVTGRQVVTVAAASPKSGNIIVIDLFTENFEHYHKNLSLIEDGAYYLCDSSGNLLFYSAPFDVDEAAMENYVKSVVYKASTGEQLENGKESFRDLNGKARGLYYYQMPNGWLSILSVPRAVLLEGMGVVVTWYAVLMVVFLTASVAYWLREGRLNKTIERTNDTIRVLGNSYYAIYRVDVDKGEYEMTKGSDYARQKLPYKGSYEALLTVLLTVLDEETGRDFEKNFSLKNIRALARRGTGEFGGDFLRQFGDQYRWVNVRLLLDKSLSQGEAVLCFRQVEEEKQRQLQHVRLLEDALAAADAGEKSQKEFFSAMSHDMRTPLNVIIGMTDLALQPGCDSEKITDYLQKIKLSGNQLLVLINDILEMSRLEQGRVTLEEQTFSICDVLHGCAAPFEEQAKQEGKRFTLITDVLTPVVLGDPSRLTQILNNLLSNALKFTKSGDSVHLSLRQMGTQNPKFLFTIEGTGPGMSKEFLPKLFEAYERETRFGAKNIWGTGLGMPIVKNLVSQMGGQITVESELGRGSRFVVTLPFVPGEALPETEEQNSAAADVLQGRHILLVEDNPLNMEITAELLKMRGAQVTPAANGREAVEAFEKSEPGFFDGILMDMQMPEMDGCEAARAIRNLNRPDARAVPIVAQTANAFAEDISRTEQAGMNAHLSKPIDMEQLCCILEELFTKW